MKFLIDVVMRTTVEVEAEDHMRARDIVVDEWTMAEVLAHADTVDLEIEQVYTTDGTRLEHGE